MSFAGIAPETSESPSLTQPQVPTQPSSGSDSPQTSSPLWWWLALIGAICGIYGFCESIFMTSYNIPNIAGYITFGSIIIYFLVICIISINHLTIYYFPTHSQNTDQTKKQSINPQYLSLINFAVFCIGFQIYRKNRLNLARFFTVQAPATTQTLS